MTLISSETKKLSGGGSTTEHTMRENIIKLLAGDNIEKWFDPSLGCSIKWVS